MNFEVSHDGMLMIKKASLALTKEDILQLAHENFAEDIADGERFTIVNVQDPDDDHFTNWILIPHSKMAEISKRIKDI